MVTEISEKIMKIELLCNLWSGKERVFIKLFDEPASTLTYTFLSFNWNDWSLIHLLSHTCP